MTAWSLSLPQNWDLSKGHIVNYKDVHYVSHQNCNTHEITTFQNQMVLPSIIKVGWWTYPYLPKNIHVIWSERIHYMLYRNCNGLLGQAWGGGVLRFGFGQAVPLRTLKWTTHIPFFEEKRPIHIPLLSWCLLNFKQNYENKFWKILADFENFWKTTHFMYQILHFTWGHWCTRRLILQPIFATHPLMDLCTQTPPPKKYIGLHFHYEFPSLTNKPISYKFKMYSKLNS